MEEYQYKARPVSINQSRLLELMELARGIGETGRINTNQMVGVLALYMKGEQNLAESFNSLREK